MFCSGTGRTLPKNLSNILSEANKQWPNTVCPNVHCIRHQIFSGTDHHFSVCFRCFLSLLSLTATISFSMWLVAFYRGFSLMFSCCLLGNCLLLGFTLILFILSSFLGCCEWLHTHRLALSVSVLVSK